MSKEMSLPFPIEGCSFGDFGLFLFMEFGFRLALKNKSFFGFGRIISNSNSVRLREKRMIIILIITFSNLNDGGFPIVTISALGTFRATEISSISLLFLQSAFSVFFFLLSSGIGIEERGEVVFGVGCPTQFHKKMTPL